MPLNVIVSLLMMFLLTACVTTGQQSHSLPEVVYLDEHYEHGQKLETEAEIFAISPEMKAYVNERLDKRNLPLSVSNLMNDLFSPAYMDIDYEYNANYSPVEVFKKGKANCMSLTILSFVLAREAGLKTRFMDVQTTENWNVGESFAYVNGHVNLEITTHMDMNKISNQKPNSTIDFLPMLSSKIMKKSTLTKSQIVALYYNNKGADALANKDKPLAYQYFKAATQLAPTAAKIWGNLATVYRQDGHTETAEAIYKAAITMAPRNRTLQENLAILYRKTGRIDEAERLYRKVNQERQDNPFYFAMQAEEALSQDRPTEAASLFRKAMKMQRQEHSFYFGLARSYLRLGELNRAQEYMIKAQTVSKDPRQQQKYYSKNLALSGMMQNHY